MKVIGHIYCLKDPTDNNRIFYVGQTVMKLNERAVNHVTESRFRMTAKGLVITKILEAGKRPIIESLERFDADSYSDIDALMNEREIYWIQQFKGLCNKNYAGLDLICDNCANPFKAKRSRAKFCSDVCRASFHQKNKKIAKENKKEKGLTELQQMKVMYNALMDKIDKIALPSINVPLFDRKTTFDGIMPSVSEKPKIRRSFEYYQQARIDCMDIEEWAALKAQIMADDFLTPKQKNLLTING